MITIFSNRIYKNKLEKPVLNYIDKTLKIFNQAKIKTYRMLSNGKSATETRRFVSKEFEINNYYEASTYQLAKGTLQSNKECQKLYIEDTKVKIEQVEKKITNNKRL